MTNLQFKQALNKIKAEYEQREASFEKAKSELIKTNKVYKVLNSEYKDLIIKNAELGNNKYDKKIAELGEKLKEIEKQAGIEKPKHVCTICNDTGKVNGKVCTCVKTLVNKELIKKCNIAEINLKSFADCDFSNLDEKSKKNQKKIYKFFKDEIIENFENTKYRNVLVCGTPGVGKTFLFSVVAGELLKKNIPTLYLSAFSLNNMFLKFHTTFSEGKYEIIEPLETVDCLLIDDFGTEPILNNVTAEYLLSLLKERVMSGKVTLINSNLMLDALNDRYGERIFSRLVDKSNSIAFLMEGKNNRI